MPPRPLITRKPTKDPTDIADGEDFEKVAEARKFAQQSYINDPKLKDAPLEQEQVKRHTEHDKHDKQKHDKKQHQQEHDHEHEKKKHKKHKQFQDVKFKPGTTAFDRHNTERTGSFHGFFALFWLALAFLALKTLLQHWRETGHFFRLELATLYRLNAADLALTDAIMVSSSVFVVGLQYAVYYGLSWNRYGWVIENIWQCLYLSMVVQKSYNGNWQWIQSVFIILHCIVMLMKQHSYATYMGYLSEVYKTRNKLVRELETLRQRGSKRPTLTPRVSVQPPSPSEEKSDGESVDSSKTLYEQSTTNDNGVFDSRNDAEAEATLAAQVKELSEELTHDGVTYPENLSLANYVDYLLVPSLVYDIVYPRTSHVRWSYVLEKTLATLGTFALMTMIVEHYILPVIPRDLATMTTHQKLAELPWLMLDMVFPFITMYLLTFYIIFECVCQWFAEVTRFADRNFYNDWWNSITWEDFARNWNVPVHRFLLRHVYHSSMSVLSVRKSEATLITFFLSSCVHELVMACMTKKIRVYLLLSQMLQLPLVMLSQTGFFKNNPLAGNVFFWFGLFTGPSFLCLAYVLF